MSVGFDDLAGPDESELALIEDEVDDPFDDDEYEFIPNDELLREP